MNNVKIKFDEKGHRQTSFSLSEGEEIKVISKEKMANIKRQSGLSNYMYEKTIKELIEFGYLIEVGDHYIINQMASVNTGATNKI